MLHTLEIYLLLFVTYAILGWCMEVIVKFIEYKRFINRGFLIGPYCPIYGMGAVSVTLCLGGFRNNPIVVFALGLVVASFLEYLTSWVMEKIFHARWWDYSNDRFNINGRICLSTMVPFGLLCLLLLYVLNPIFIKTYESFSYNVLHGTCTVIAIIFFVDVVISTIILLSFRNDNEGIEGDNTEEMAKKVREIIASRGWGQRRLVIAFPNLKNLGTKIKQNAKETIDKYNKKIETIKEKYSK